MDTPVRAIAYCGNDCSRCPRRLATQSGDPAQLQRVAELWFRLGWRERVVSAEEIACNGCSASHWCRHQIAACAGPRGVQHCGGCADYRSCERIEKAMARTEAYALSSRELVEPAVFEQLSQAFYFKRRNLER